LENLKLTVEKYAVRRNKQLANAESFSENGCFRVALKYII